MLRENNVVVSRRKYLEEEREEYRKEYFTNIQKDQLRTRCSENIVDYGLLLSWSMDSGVKLHINDMSWEESAILPNVEHRTGCEIVVWKWI